VASRKGEFAVSCRTGELKEVEIPKVQAAGG